MQRSSIRKSLLSRSGQAIIESLIVIFLIGLIFAGMLQVSELVVSSEVLSYSAACGARAKTVGFNDWMVEKTIRVAAIPNSGRLITPDYRNVDVELGNAVTTKRPGDLWMAVVSSSLRPSSSQFNLEMARIPEYMASANNMQARHILEYDRWQSGSSNALNYTASWVVHTLQDGSSITNILVRTRQDSPMWVPLHQAFYAGETVPLSTNCELETHYTLYLNDEQM